MFYEILSVGIFLVFLQGYFAWRDGFLTQRQLQGRGIKDGWAFVQHGGMWADLFLLSPLVGWMASKYGLNYGNPLALSLLMVGIVGTIAAGLMFAGDSHAKPEAHARGGKTTIAGHIHGLYAVFAFWIIALFYFGRTEPKVATLDFVLASAVLTPFVVLGIIKFGRGWRLEGRAVAIILALWAAVWGVTWFKTS